MNEYKVLVKQEYQFGAYRLVPIRFEDRYEIMKWRNEQIYHLRQESPLTKEDQDLYFKSVVTCLFEQEFPNQILFSFLKNNKLIGYGGLVHIDWKNKNAEISFLMDTKLEEKFFEKMWTTFLNLIEKVAFDYLHLQKIFTYSFAVRPRLYPVLKKQLFIPEERKEKAVQINNKWVDIWIHSKFRDKLLYRKATLKDSKQLFDWSNDLTNRKNSLNKEPISWGEHQEWFKSKLANNEASQIFIFYQKNPIGVLRLGKSKEGNKISFSVDKKCRGKGFGFRMINQIINDFPALNFVAEVIRENKSSHKIFIKNGFKILKPSKKADVNVVTYIKN